MSQPKPARIVMQRCGWAGVRPVLRGGETGKGRTWRTQTIPIAQLRQRAAELEREIIWPIITNT